MSSSLSGIDTLGGSGTGNSSARQLDDSGRPVRMLWPAIFAVIQGAVWGGILGILLSKVSSFEKIFRDFKTEVPLATKLLLNLTHVLHDYWIVAVLLIVVWMAVNFAVALLLQRSRSRILKCGWYLPTALAPMAFLALTIQALFIPLTQLISDLSH
jgi:hypothetical protein